MKRKKKSTTKSSNKNNKTNKAAAPEKGDAVDCSEDNTTPSKKPPKTLEELSAEVTPSKGHPREKTPNNDNAGDDKASEQNAANKEQVIRVEKSAGMEQAPASNPSNSNNKASSTNSIEVNTTKVPNGDWEEFVLDFQDHMQHYRTVVFGLADQETQESEELEQAERHLHFIGKRLVATCNNHETEVSIKSRGRQLLQYVSGYCQGQGRHQLHSDFGAFIASCAEGKFFFDV